MRDMTLADFEAWVAEDASVVRTRAGASTASTEEFALAQALKLAEEGGELAEQLLGHFGFQRASKAARFDEHRLGLELADVAITAWELVRIIGGDLARALRKGYGLGDAATLRDLETAAVTRGLPAGGSRLRALRQGIRLDASLSRLAAAVEGHYELFGQEERYPVGPSLAALDVVYDAHALAAGLGLDLFGAVLEKRDIILGRCSEGDA